MANLFLRPAVALAFLCLVSTATEAFKKPRGTFQLRNPKTGQCAAIENNSDAGWAKVVGRKCGCGNDHHYWKINGKEIVSQGGIKINCLANWSKGLVFLGVTQCGCIADNIHSWRFEPLQDGSFQLITEMDDSCVYLPGVGQQLDYDDCDSSDETQKWVFYDACNPEPPPTPPPTAAPTPPPPTQPPQPINVIPQYLVYFFDNGSMNWLTATRYIYLVGGRWDAVNFIYYTSDGTPVKPGSQLWTAYFGDVQPNFLNVLFPNGKTWNDVFGWMTPAFFNTWQPSPTPTQPPYVPQPQPQPPNVIPNYQVTFFNNGQMNWLTPQRYTYLVGGRWDPVNFVYYTANNQPIRPSTQEWTTYFGNLQPNDLNVFFPNGGYWNDVFGWMTPSFFQTWTAWQQAPAPAPVPFNIPIVISGYIPPQTIQLFSSGRANSLTPNRIRLLSGGQWTGSQYITNSGVQVTPGTPTWSQYFGSIQPADVNTLFGGTAGYWDTSVTWLTNAVKDVPSQMVPGDAFPWDSFFAQMNG